MPVDIVRRNFFTPAEIGYRIKQPMKDMAELCDKSGLSLNQQFVVPMMLSAVAAARNAQGSRIPQRLHRGARDRRQSFAELIGAVVMCITPAVSHA